MSSAADRSGVHATSTSKHLEQALENGLGLRIAIYGISSAVGAEIGSHCDADEKVDAVIGLDATPPRDIPEKCHYVSFGPDANFEAVFREFKKGVKEQLSESDYEAHYDLGIAYREMGLVEDAVSEFRIALGSGEHKLASLHMLGLCALDQGLPRDGAAHFEQALSLPAIPAQQQAPLRLDLARAFEENSDERVRAMTAWAIGAATAIASNGVNHSNGSQDNPNNESNASIPITKYHSGINGNEVKSPCAGW